MRLAKFHRMLNPAAERVPSRLRCAGELDITTGIVFHGRFDCIHIFQHDLLVMQIKRVMVSSRG
jgi:hypothetical protein